MEATAELTAKATLEPHYRSAFDRALSAFTELSEEDWTASSRLGKWYAKDFLAHLVASQEQEGNPVTEQAIAGKKPVMEDFGGPEDINNYNARIIETVRLLPTGEILDRLRATFEKNLAMLEGVSDDDLKGTVEHPGWLRSGTLAQVFYTGYLHLPLHYQDIRRCVRNSKTLPHWMEASTAEEVHDVLARTFDYMPLTYIAERAGDLKATIVFNLTGPGGGEWTVDMHGPDCHSYEGRPEHPGLEITATPASWVDITTKELNPIWGFLSRRLKTKGNIQLAMKLESLFEIT